jgi:hypothetical protein
VNVEEVTESFAHGAAILAVIVSAMPPQPQIPPPYQQGNIVQKVAGYALVPASYAFGKHYELDQIIESNRFSLDQSATWAMLKIQSEAEETTAQRFHRLASEWLNETRHVSSLTIMAGHPKYREIVGMGMNVVPFLIVDLERNRRFWLPALREITGIRPYDSSDEGNPKRMMRSWIQWGRNKNYIEK